MLLTLGGGQTIYENAENIHFNSVQKSAERTLLFLETKPRSEKNLSQIKHALIDILSEREDDTKGEWYYGMELDEMYGKSRNDRYISTLRFAFRRIRHDKCKYGNTNVTLADIVSILYEYCSTHPTDSEFLINRLIDELMDSSMTCSSGYAYRMANVLTGVSDFGIRIDYCDQMKAKFYKMLVDEIKNLSNCDDILEEMMLPSSSSWARPAFLTVLREKYLSIRDSLYEEYKTYMDDDEFDLNMRISLICFEGNA